MTAEEGGAPLVGGDEMAAEWAREARYVLAELDRHGDAIALLTEGLAELRRLVATLRGAVWVVGTVAGIIMPAGGLYLSWSRYSDAAPVAAVAPAPSVTPADVALVAELVRTLRATGQTPASGLQPAPRQ